MGPSSAEVKLSLYRCHLTKDWRGARQSHVVLWEQERDFGWKGSS